MPPADSFTASITIRTELQPGDIGTIIAMHGLLYAREYGFNVMFEAYVADPLAQFVREHTNRERLWMAERDGRLIGCIAIVAASRQTAQLRWYLVAPEARGSGLGRALLREAVAFCRDHGYIGIVLWTVNTLTAAAHLYQSMGFRKTEEKPGNAWGSDAVEEKYELTLI